MKLIAQEGPLRDLVLDLDKGKDWIIGRDPDQTNFLLEDTSVSRKHAHLYKTDEGIFIKNLSTTNPTEVNDSVIDEYLLEENDKVKIGDNIFLFTGESEKEVKHKEIKKEEKQEYETIYEEPEISFPTMTSDTPFVLKVISGPNAGAEFGIEKSKEYIIGKDPNQADIIFTDLSVSKQNTKISADADGNIFIEDLKSKNGTYINNTPVIEKTQITHQDLITVGTTTFLIVSKEAAEETIYSPAPTFEVEEEAEEKEEKKVSVWKKQFIPTRHLIFAGSITIIIFVIFISFFGLFKSHEIEIAEKEPKEAIQNALEKYEDLEFSYNPSSASLFLTGHVLTSIDKQELMYDLDQLTYINDIEDNVIVDEFVWKDFNNVLNEIEAFRSVSLHSPKAGIFVISGYVADPKTAEELTDYINSNFPYIDKLQNKVVIEEVLQAQIASQLAAQNMSGITFEIIAGELVLAGRYNKKEEKDLERLITEFKKTEGIHFVKNLAIPSSASAARIDLSNKYKITGYAKYDGENFSVVANGKIVSLGGLLDGMQITSITPDEILLEKDELKYKINYSR